MFPSRLMINAVGGSASWSWSRADVIPEKVVEACGSFQNHLRGLLNRILNLANEVQLDRPNTQFTIDSTDVDHSAAQSGRSFL